MPQVPINYAAVVVAAVASMVIGSVWYGPLFGKMWMKLSGMTEEKMKSAKGKGMGKSYGLMFVGSLVMAYILAHSLEFASSYLDAYGASAGVMSGLWSWLGFVAPVTMSSVLWEGKPWKLWFLNNGYNLLSLVMMGVVLALWQ